MSSLRGRSVVVVGSLTSLVLLALFFAAGHATARDRAAQASNTATTTTNKPDGSTTVTTTTTYSDGSTTTTTNYDKDGHDAGTTRVDVQTKDGETTTTTTIYDGSGHEIKKTVQRVGKDGTRITITYDGSGRETGRTTGPAGQAPPAASATAQTSAPTTATAQLVGLVYDNDSQPGEQVSASLVTNPKDYAGIPALRVVEMQIASGVQVTLQGLIVDLGDGRQQPADAPLTLKVPAGAAIVPVTVHPRDNATPVAQGRMSLTPTQLAAAPNAGSASDFTTSPVCQNTSVINGPLSGNAQGTTRVTVDNQPARILAETPRRAHVDTANIPTGATHSITVEDGPRRAAFPAVVKPSVLLNAAKLDLLRGQKTTWTATVDLPVPASAWRHGGASSGPTDLSTIGRLFPGFRAPRAGEPAVALFWVTNGSPETISFKPSRNGVYTRVLHQQDFANGRWTLPENGVIQSERSGRFALNGVLETFFDPVPGTDPRETGQSVIGAPPNKPGGATLAIAIDGSDFADPKKVTATGKREFRTPPKCKTQSCSKPERIPEKEVGAGQIYCSGQKCGGSDCKDATCQIYQAWRDPKKDKDKLPTNLTVDDAGKWQLIGGEYGNSKAKPQTPDPKYVYTCGCESK